MISRACVVTLFVSLIPCAAFGQQSPIAGGSPDPRPVTTVPAAAQPSAKFDVEAATNAYLALIPSDAKARSDAYFEGGYWLILWDFLYGLGVALVLLNLRWSAGMRNLAQRLTRFKPLQTLIYWTEYLVVTTIMVFPLTVYEDYFREHKYGLATQTFGPWMGDQMKGFLVNLVLGGILAVVLFGIVRRLPRTWWIWGAIATLSIMACVVAIAPVYIVPLFNKVTRLDDPKNHRADFEPGPGKWDSGQRRF